MLERAVAAADPAPGAKGYRPLRSLGRHHQGHDDACEQRAGFPVVALPGVGNMPESGESQANKARLFYVAATRATETLFITLSGRGGYMDRFAA